MPTNSLTTWIQQDGRPADLAALLPDLKVYADLAVQWRAIAAELWKLGTDAPVDDPRKLAAYLAAALDDAKVREVFATLQLQGLLEALVKVRDRLGDALSPWHKLLQPMSDFVPVVPGSLPVGADSFGIDDGGKDGALALALPRLAEDAAAKIGPAALTFNISASAGLACEAGANWPFLGDGVPPGLLRIGGTGKVETKAGLSLPFGQFGTGTATADASAECGIGFFYRPDAPQQSFGETLYRALGGLPGPLDLDQIRHAMQLAGLEGIALGCRGGVASGIDLVLGENVELPTVAAGTGGLRATLSFQRNATWILSLRKVPGGMRFVLSRDRESEKKWSVGADIKLDLAPLARRIHDLLLRANTAAGPLLAHVTPFLSPGTYLATQAGGLLKTTVQSIVEQQDLRDALVHDASLILGSNAQDESALVDLLVKKIADLAATKSAALLGDVDAWTASVVQGLTTDLPALGATGIPALLQARVQPLLADVRHQFDTLVTQLTGNAATAVPLAQELAALGTQVKAGEARADQLLAGVRELVTKFDGFSRELLAATADTANAKLQARFGWSGDASSSSNYELIGTIANDAAPEAADLWRALATGQMAPFQQLLAGTIAAPRGFLLDPASSLSRLTAGSRGFSFDFILFGMDLSITSIVTGKATITRSGTGELIVAAEGSALRKIDALHEERTISFVSAWDLVLARLDAAAGERRAMSVGVTFDHNDQNLEPHEVNGLFAGLSAQKLIDAGRPVAAMNLYQKWRVGAALDAKVRGSIKVRMRLPDQAVLRMVAIGRAVNAGNKPARSAIFRLAVQAQLATGVASPAQLASDVETIKQTHTLTGSSHDPLDYIVALWNFDPNSGSSDGATYRAVDQLLPRAGAFVSLLATMARIYDARPVFDRPPSAGEMNEAQYAQAERELAAAARKWLALNAVFFLKFRAELHPALMAFFRLLAIMNTPPADPDAAVTDGLSGDVMTASADGLFVIAMARDGDAEPTAI